MYKLKQIPEDFIVKEISNVKMNPSGPYTYILIRKKLKNTMDVVKEISKLLNIPDKKIGFAGSKDKHAITQQVFSIERGNKEKLLGLKMKDVSIEILGYGNIPVSLGDLRGNLFEIVVRNLDLVRVIETDFVENYFDEQRFSSNNVKIGRHLIKKEFDQAASLLDDWKVKDYLLKKESDYIGAIRLLPKRLLKMYVHAYQSYLWNETLVKYLKLKKWKEVDYSLGKLVFVKEKENLQVPLIGFGVEIDEKLKGIIEEIMERENLSFSDFIIRQIPELSLEGDLRDAFVSVQDFKVGIIEEDELNSGKKKVKVSFILGKGSYATMVIKRLFG
jgi:tRNA pseudouridine13 synthase